MRGYCNVPERMLTMSRLGSHDHWPLTLLTAGYGLLYYCSTLLSADNNELWEAINEFLQLRPVIILLGERKIVTLTLHSLEF